MQYLTVYDVLAAEGKKVGLEQASIANDVYMYWKRQNDLRQDQIQQWSDTRRYAYATDTRRTTAVTSPWKNKTTRNKLSFIADKLITHYIRNLMPNDKFFRWYPARGANVPPEIPDRINRYMTVKLRSKYVRFRHVMEEALTDLVFTGNTFGTLQYERKTKKNLVTGEEEQVFQGAVPVRIAPEDMTFDPTIMKYEENSICRRAVIARPTLFAMAENLGYDPEVMEKLKTLDFISTEIQDWIKQNHLNQDGVQYLNQINEGKIELLEFYGDIWDETTKEILYNHHIVVADRLFVLLSEPNPVALGIKPIVFSGWRKRRDNLWGQGPLDQIVGLQYRIDHLENLKADSTDMMSMPVIKVYGEGIEEEFEWKPGETWHVPPNGDIKIEYPDPKIILYNEDILTYERAMEEYAGVPRETAGFRTPGEKTAFEVDQLLSNANAPFEEKLMQFEDDFLEPLLNLMLEYNLKNASIEELATVFPENLLGDSQGLLEAMQDAVSKGSIYAVGSKHYKMEQKKVQEIINMIKLGAEVQSPHIDQFNALKVIEREGGLTDDLIVRFGASLEEQMMLQLRQKQLEEELQSGAMAGTEEGGGAESGVPTEPTG